MLLNYLFLLMIYLMLYKISHYYDIKKKNILKNKNIQ